MRSLPSTTRWSASGWDTARTASSTPDFFRKSAGLGSATSGLLGLYLAGDAAADGPPRRRSSTRPGTPPGIPDWAETHPHPFLHFLEVGLTERAAAPARHRHGLRARRRPRQGPVARGSGDAGVRPQAPRRRHETAAEPRGAQSAAGSLLCGGASCASSARRRTGAASGWFSSSAARASTRPIWPQPRDYDVLLNCYQAADADPRADAVVFQAGTKTTAIRRLLDERPDLLLRYEAVLFLDDDVEIGAARHRRAVRGGGGARTSTSPSRR